MYRAVAPFEDEGRNKSQTSGSSCFQGIVGLAALITGAMYLNEPDICPWSPLLPVFLLTYGVVSIFSPFVYFIMMMCGACCSSSSNEWPIWSCMAFISIISLVGGLGIIIWGFVLLYSNPNPVTYDKYINSTVVNENYCHQAVYLVPMIISWSFVAFLALGCLCLCCIKACAS